MTTLQSLAPIVALYGSVEQVPCYNPIPIRFESETETHPCGVEYYIGFNRAYRIDLDDESHIVIHGKNREEARTNAARRLNALQEMYPEFPILQITSVEAHNPYKLRTPTQ